MPGPVGLLEMRAAICQHQ